MTTATRTVYTSAAAEVLTSANFEKMPKGWIGYAYTDSNNGAITSEADLTDLSVTVTIPEDRLIIVRTRVLFDIDNTGAANISGFVNVDGTNQGQFARGKGLQNSELLGSAPVFLAGLTGGSHTIKLRAARTSGTGVVTTIASSTNLNFLIVEDCGPDS